MTLSTGTIEDRLREIDADLEARVGVLERAALAWYQAKRQREHDRAVAFLKAEGTVAERNAEADKQTALDGSESEAEYESVRAVVRVLETRASIGQSLLKAYGRAA